MRTTAASLSIVAALFAAPAGLRADDGVSAGHELQGTVEGIGATPEAAKSDAFAKAQDAVRDYLAANYPDILWRPTPDYLERARILVSQGRPWKKDESGYHVEYRLNKLTSQHLAELRELSRVPWMYQRHRQAALVLAGLVLALLILSVCLRLDEAMHGYYSGRLLGAAVGLVALVGIAVWWWM